MRMLQATVSHEVMHPISNVKSFAEQLMEAFKFQDKKAMKKYYELIIDTAKLVQCRMKDLLDQNLLENGKFVPRNFDF